MGEERFCDVGRGITLCYERFGDPADAPLLLVMGLGMQMVAWPDDFCEQLAGHGFHVVRFDNRDVGRSTHLSGPPPTLRQMTLRRFPSSQYRLDAMALDTAALLRALELAPAHVVGASMGGMIAQVLTLTQPQLVRSLTSIMSNPGSRWNGQPTLRTYRVLLGRVAAGREAALDYAVELFRVIGSPEYPQDVEALREIAGRAYDRELDRSGTGRQLAAILASPDRTRALRAVTTPTLVIHGDGDRLIAPSGGRATARAIPGAQLMRMPGMGHDLPRPLWPALTGAIAEHARRADARLATAA